MTLLSLFFFLWFDDRGPGGTPCFAGDGREADGGDVGRASDSREEELGFGFARRRRRRRSELPLLDSPETRTEGDCRFVSLSEMRGGQGCRCLRRLPEGRRRLGNVRPCCCSSGRRRRTKVAATPTSEVGDEEERVRGRSLDIGGVKGAGFASGSENRGRLFLFQPPRREDREEGFAPSGFVSLDRERTKGRCCWWLAHRRGRWKDWSCRLLRLPEWMRTCVASAVCRRRRKRRKGPLPLL